MSSLGGVEWPESPVEPSVAVAQPAWFGSDAQPLFGWFHPARLPARDCAVVLCNPFGYDAMIAHYAYRHLAERLAAAGVAAFRFDYLGTGDSSGEDAAPDRLEDWIGSIEAARAEALRLSGARAIALFGLRVGGLLAIVAAQRSPVDDLILLGPSTSGRACVRELRALRKLQPPVPAPDNPEGSAPDDENFGFLMTEPMRAALAQLEPLRASARPAERALVIARDDVDGAESALVEHLRACSVDAALSKTPGYTLALRGDPYTCELPTRAWDEIVGWMTSAYPVRRSQGAVARAPRSSAVTIGRVREEAVYHNGLFGLLTEPADGRSPRARTGIALLSIGANHHIGSNRMYVRWARSWAALGYSVLRFDLSGVGDSPARAGRGDKEVYSPHSMPEAREAIDFLESRGCARVVLGGLCSGAYVAFHAAVEDPRAAGIFLVNQPTFHWKEGDSLELHARAAFKATRFYAGRARDLETYRRVLRGEVHVRAVLTELARRLVAGRMNAAIDLGVRLGLIHEPDDIARGFRQLAGRGCAVHVILGSNDGAVDEIERHLGAGARKMRGARSFRMDVLEGTDHIFTPRGAQDRLAAVLTDQLLSRFG